MADVIGEVNAKGSHCPFILGLFRSLFRVCAEVFV
jgi:hypothetical protein